MAILNRQRELADGDRTEASPQAPRGRAATIGPSREWPHRAAAVPGVLLRSMGRRQLREVALQEGRWRRSKVSGRLRAEFAAQYPYLTPGVWESAAVLATALWPRFWVCRTPTSSAESAHSTLRTSSSALGSGAFLIGGDYAWRTLPRSSP
jgi:hypothetical protein